MLDCSRNQIIGGSLHVAEVAKRAGVTPATVRYYARIGLLHPDREPDNQYRRFDYDDLHRVMFTRRAQALGLTIGDIKDVLKTVENGESPCAQVRALVHKRLKLIRREIATLHATEARIQDAMDAWPAISGQAANDGEFCPLIERVDVSPRETACEGA